MLPMKFFRNETDVKMFTLNRLRTQLAAHDHMENIRLIDDHVAVVSIRRHGVAEPVKMTVFLYMPAGKDAISGYAVRKSGTPGESTVGIAVGAWRERSENILTRPMVRKAETVHLMHAERSEAELEKPASPELISDRHPTLDLPASHEGPRLRTSYNPTGAKIDDYSPGELRRIADELSYVWGDFADEDIMEKTGEITLGLRALADRIENGA